MHNKTSKWDFINVTIVTAMRLHVAKDVRLWLDFDTMGVLDVTMEESEGLNETKNKLNEEQMDLSASSAYV